MSLTRAFARALGAPEARASSDHPFGRELEALIRGQATTTSGERVDRDTALQVSAVFGSVRIISETITTLPVATFIREGGARVGYKRPEWLDRPNSEPLGRLQFIGQVLVSMLLSGNAYVFTLRDKSGKVLGLEVLNPDHVQPDKRNGRRIFRVEGHADPLTPMDILHIPGLMLPGSNVGVSPIKYAQETIGISLAAQKYGAAFFGNGALPGALVEVDGSLSPQGVQQLKAGWSALHEGAGNAHKLAVLTEGAKFTKVALSPDEAQFLQTRQFQVPDIARIYGVPPHLLADASGSTSWGSGLAEQNIAFAQHCLRPWVERVEAALSWLLWTEGAPPAAFVKINMEGLMRGSLKERMESYSTGLQQGVYNLDEVRAYEDLAPIPNGKGKAHRVPLNLGPVGSMPPATQRALAAALGLSEDDAPTT